MAVAVTSISPTSGALAGGTACTITGTGLVAVNSVEFDGVAATNVVAVSDTTVTCTSPAGTAGPADVLVDDGVTTDTLTGGFTYMTMPVEHALAHELILEVDTGTVPETPVWTKVRFTSEIEPSFEPNLQDATTYDDEGQTRQVKTSAEWSIEFTINRYRDATGLFMPEAEKLRKAGDPESFGEDAFVHVRWYDKLGADEAYEGTAYVQWERAESAADALGKAGVTLTGYGPLTAIANPNATP